jgi:hypothetical protein
MGRIAAAFRQQFLQVQQAGVLRIASATKPILQW